MFIDELKEIQSNKYIKVRSKKISNFYFYCLSLISMKITDRCGQAYMSDEKDKVIKKRALVHLVR